MQLFYVIALIFSTCRAHRSSFHVEIRQDTHESGVAPIATSTGPSPTGADCSALKALPNNVPIIAGQVLQLVCKSWHASWGEFPVASVNDAVNLLETTFKKGGVYDQVKELASQRLNAGSFCWRRNDQRPLQEPTGYSCPPLPLATQDPPTKVQPQMRQGKWQCEHSCTDVCGDLPSMGEVGLGMCGCMADMGPDGGPMLETHSRVVDATPEGCASMIGNECYGKCPDGFKQTFLAGAFFPLCTEECAVTTHPTTCGLGCAVSVSECATDVVEEVGEVVKTVGQAAGFLTGDASIALTTDALVSVAEFASSVIGKMVVSATEWTEEFRSEQQNVGLLTALLHMVSADKLNKLTGEWEHSAMDLQEQYGRFVGLAGELAIKFSAARAIGLGDVAQTFLKHGAAGILEVNHLLHAFVWPSCTVDSQKVVLPRSTTSTSSGT